MPTSLPLPNVFSNSSHVQPARQSKASDAATQVDSGNPSSFRQSLEAATSRNNAVRADPSSGREPSAAKEPSANKQPSTDREPSAGKEPSANKQPSAGKEPSANKQPSAGKEPSEARGAIAGSEHTTEGSALKNDVAANELISPLEHSETVGAEGHFLTSESSPAFLSLQRLKAFAAGVVPPQAGKSFDHMSYLERLTGTVSKVFGGEAVNPSQSLSIGIDGKALGALGTAERLSPVSPAEGVALNVSSLGLADLAESKSSGLSAQGTIGVANAPVPLISEQSAVPLMEPSSASKLVLDPSIQPALSKSALTAASADGKSLPQGMVGQLPDPLMTSSPQVGAISGEGSKNMASLDATLLASPALGSAVKQSSADFKVLLEEGLRSQSITSSMPGERTPLIGRETDAFQQTLSAVDSLNSTLPALRLEGRTAIPMTVAFGHTQWTNSFAERTAWAVGQGIQTADIQLDPPELGPLQVKIHVHQDQASVTFTSANPVVRDAVEQTLGRLRELLQEQGLELVDGGVADHQSGQQRDQAGSGESSGEQAAEFGSTDGGGAVVDPNLHTIAAAAPWGVDYYA